MHVLSVYWRATVALQYTQKFSLELDHHRIVWQCLTMDGLFVIGPFVDGTL